MKLGNAQLHSRSKVLDFASGREKVNLRRRSPSNILNKFKSGFSKKPKSKTPKHTSKVKKIAKKVGIIFSLTLLFSILIGIVLLIGLVSTYSRDLPNIDEYFKQSDFDGKDTIIYDRTGTKELYRLQGNVIKERITLNEVPNKLKWAFLSAEDAEFESHKGLNLVGLSRALWCTVKSKGKAACGGGSSITQQLVKKTTHEEERTLERKIKEAVLAMKVEQEYTKDYILEFYLNIVPEGGTLEGVKAGSKYIFGVEDMNKLSLAQMAYLAAIPNEPSTLSPYGGKQFKKEKGIERATYVLNRMLELKDKTQVTEEEVKKAKEELPNLQFTQRRIEKKAPFYVNEVIEQLDELYKDKVEGKQVGSDYLRGKGYKVISAVDYDTQVMLEDTVKTQVKSAEFQKKIGAQNAAAVITDPNTGEVLAIVGSRDYNEKQDPNDKRFDPEFNVATSERSAGSTIKPFVYLTAIRQGYNPSTIVPDFAIDMRDQGATVPYNILNYGGKQGNDFITLRTALRGSKNIGAVAAYHMTGRDNFADTYFKLNGWAKFKDNIAGPSAAIGGANLPLLEQVHAYSTLAAGGVYRPNKFVLKILDDKDNIVYDNTKDLGKQTIESKFIYIINDMNKRYWLCDGADRYADPFLKKIQGEMDFGCKTGTADNGYGETSDLAFMGYTTNFAMGVWAGNNCGIKCPIKPGDPKHVATSDDLFRLLYKPFFEKHYKANKITRSRFTQPAGVKKVAICSKTGRAYDPELCPGVGGTQVFDFVTDTTPAMPEDMIKKALITDCAGTPKLASAKDMDLGLAVNQYYFSYKFPIKRIQDAVNAKKNFSQPPVEECTVERVFNKPQVTIVSPAGGSYKPGDTLKISAAITSDVPLVKVEVFLDSIIQETFTAAPYELNITLPSNISAGNHTVTVLATDKSNQQGRDDRTFNVSNSPSPTTSPTPTSILPINNRGGGRGNGQGSPIFPSDTPTSTPTPQSTTTTTPSSTPTSTGTVNQ